MFDKIRALLKNILFTSILFEGTWSFSIQAKEPLAIIDLASDTPFSQANIDTICERISKTVSADGRYDVFERHYLPFTFKELGLPERLGCSEKKCLVNIGKKIGAKYMIGGSLHKTKKEAVICLLFVNVGTNNLIKTVSGKVSSNKSTFLHEELPVLVTDLIAGGNPSISLNKEIQPDTNSQINNKADIQLTYEVSQKAPLDSFSQKSGEKKSSVATMTIIGASLATAGAGAVYYFKYWKKRGNTSGAGDDLSIVDAPNHEQ
jgi:hypothetical protein